MASTYSLIILKCVKIFRAVLLMENIFPQITYFISHSFYHFIIVLLLQASNTPKNVSHRVCADVQLQQLKIVKTKTKSQEMHCKTPQNKYIQ